MNTTTQAAPIDKNPDPVPKVQTPVLHDLSNGVMGETYFINRELSWLAFNKRVVEEAENPNHPLFERLRFLSISSSNLDEFYMVRVAGLQGQVREGVRVLSLDGKTPTEQLGLVNEKAATLIDEQQKIWLRLKSELQAAGVILLQPDELKSSEKNKMAQKFDSELFPILTPMAIDPAHPFPFIPNQGFSVVLKLLRDKDQKILYALVPLPSGVQRFWEVPRLTNAKTSAPKRYLTIENLITLFLDKLFPGFTVLGQGLFRILRDSDIEIEEEAEDLVREFEMLIKQRRLGSVVRIKLTADTPNDLREFVIEQFKVNPNDALIVDGMLGLMAISELIPSDRPDLKFKAFKPRYPERVRDNGSDLFAAIRVKDILVHHPFESFDVVVQFLRQAAQDKDVVAIKQTLYRTSTNSPIVAALIEAAEQGKNVTALIEIKARFDEEANLKWARAMERAGVHVIYGFVEYKTHAKCSVVVRREGAELRTYCHFGTGNYHPITAKVYTDLSLFTCNPEMGRDAMRVFNYVTGYAVPETMERLYFSPLTMKPGLLQLIDKEISNARQGLPAQIWAKLNALVDGTMITKLYEASQAGVQIDLVVRGICCLRPGVTGLSDNIRVKSVVGRFLEHSRIVCFANGKALPSDEARVFISSADWMSRNLDRRVEMLIPILNPTVHRQVLDQIMVATINDEAQSWWLDQYGTYSRHQNTDNEKPFSAHEYFMTHPSLSGRGRAVKD
jgi:polyphosphate kinase